MFAPLQSRGNAAHYIHAQRVMREQWINRTVRECVRKTLGFTSFSQAELRNPAAAHKLFAAVLAQGVRKELSDLVTGLHSHPVARAIAGRSVGAVRVEDRWLLPDGSCYEH
jgi:hypothetical protein